MVEIFLAADIILCGALRGSFFVGPGGQISFYATRGTAEAGANMPRSLMCILWIRHVLIRFSQAHFSDFLRCISQIIEVYYFTRPDGLRRREPMCPVLRSGGGLQLQQYHSFICFAPSTTKKFDPKLSDTQFRINFFLKEQNISWRKRTIEWEVNAQSLGEWRLYKFPALNLWTASV